MNRAEETFQRRLREGAEQLGIEMPKEGVARLLIHFRLLSKWADRVNLTTVRDPEGMAELLYLDSAVLQKHIGAGSRLHDVGTGAGFPGMVVRALRPDLRVTLTEARRKKVSFLKQAAREMGLTEGLEIRHQRLGWDAGADRELWPEVVSRAAFPPSEWIRLGAPLVAPGGRLWVCSGPPHPEVDDAGEEGVLKDLDDCLPEGFSQGPIHDYRLPACGRRRLLVTLVRSG
ncbi:16S rRNA (guanine(527)-N(7))-methyltransferase RsmG [Myxococcota bacterium]